MLQWCECHISSGMPTEGGQSHQPLADCLHCQLDPSTKVTGCGFGNVILRATPFCLTTEDIQINLTHSAVSVQK